MIVDASAILAIVLREPEGPQFLDQIIAEPRPKMSVINWMEVAIRVERQGVPDSVVAFDSLVEELGLELIPANAEQGLIARQAYRLYGKGSGHPAQLNLGDCFAYALAASTGEPLLFKGGDFAHTDVMRA
ncbi:type II toxin-antitoxin system VapC family toxin [Glycocaulis sp.]|uniref:type II toxin-antitoxin system VapC family toxin n=1 Tax=Glycocaulis sp. TaxID=1969725 RepID=UPI003F708BB4